MEARSIYDLLVGVVILCGFILVLVTALITYACIRFRAKENAPEPKPVHGNRRLETLWTAIPLLTVAVLMVFTIKTMIVVSPAGVDGTPDIIVTGHQWWWEIRYPLGNGSDAITANEIHVPVGKRFLMELRAADVIHDFWVPELGRKIDAIPGHPNRVWLEADHPGTYLGFCAEFCGASHAWMQIRVIAEDPRSYDAWLKNLIQPAIVPETASAKRGLELFRTNTCVNCHQITGVSTPVQVGPDLTHLAGRVTLVAGALRNTPLDLKHWLRNPDQVKPGARMPVFGFTQDQLEDLSSYLESLK